MLGVAELAGRDQHRDLLLTPTESARQQAGGDWSTLFGHKTAIARFAPGNPVRAHPALAWFAALQLLSLLALPFTARALSVLPDRGYPLSKPLGLLALVLPAWLGVVFGLVAFTPGTVFGWAALMACLAAAVAVRRRHELFTFLRARWREVLVCEVLFLAAYLFFYALRAANPDLWHPDRGGEKPMDFAYLNAVIKSTTLPPYDPWFAGGYLNYYYFGQFITAAVVKPLGIAPEVAYNLALPTFAALTAAAALSLASNLVATTSRAALGERLPGPALLTGVVAAMLVLIAGNLDALRQWIVRVLQAGPWSWLSGRVELAPFDWWGSSRVIRDSTAITEFPYFSFLLGDLHPHLMALPFAITGAGVAFAVLLNAVARSPWRSRLGPLVLLGLLMAVLRMTNTWDVPIQALLAVAAALGGSYLASRSVRPRALGVAVAEVAVVGGVAWLVSLPFAIPYDNPSSHFAAAAETTPPGQYLLHFGLLALLCAGFVADRVLRRRQVTEASRGGWAGIVAWGRRPVSAAFAYGLALTLTIATVGVVALDRVTTAMVLAAALAVGWLAVLDARRQAPAGVLCTYALLLAGLLITTGVEVIRLRDDAGRMNTVFKFYFQAWWLFAIPAAYGARAWLDRLRGGLDSAQAGRARTLGAAVAGCLSLTLAALLYAFSATGPRLADRFGPTDSTVDGTAYMTRAVYTDDHGRYELGRDYRAIVWAREHIRGSPVILEGLTPLYRWGNRFSVYTGLPAVIGWDYHQTQQRRRFQDAVHERRARVDAFYGTESPESALETLRRYGVGFVFVGALERSYYPPSGVDKIASLPGLRRVYDRDEVQVYRVDQASVARALEP